MQSHVLVLLTSMSHANCSLESHSGTQSPIICLYNARKATNTMFS